MSAAYVLRAVVKFSDKGFKSTLLVGSKERRVALGLWTEVGGLEVNTELREGLRRFGGETPQVLVIEASGWMLENETLPDTSVKRDAVEKIISFLVRLST